MAYTEYLQRLLSPLGVYELREESVSGAMVAALGEELDAIWAQLRQDTADAFPQTAGATALRAWEHICPPHFFPATAEEQRNILTYLLSREEVNCSASAIVALLAVCGFEATVDEDTEAPKIDIYLPTAALAGAQEKALKAMVRELVPAHLTISWHIGSEEDE